MKKHLIAAAVAAAVAVPAAAQVTVYGVLSSGYSSTETDIDGEVVKASSTGTQGLQSGSRLGFRGNEDLGGGMKAGFVYERGIKMDSATTDSIRQAFVSVSGGFGEVRLGRGNGLAKDIYDGFHAHAGSGFVPGNQGAALAALLGDDLDANYGNVRYSNIVTYISPSMSGFSVKAQYGQDKTDEDGDVESTKVQNVGFNFASGPLAIGYARDLVKGEDVGDTAKVTTDIFGGSYNFGVATGMLTHTRVKLAATGVDEVKVSDTSVGVNVPFGSAALIASVSNGDLKVADEKIKTQGFQVGINYNLSKRTLLLARYGDSEAKIDDFKATIDGFGIGLQHSF
jgi:predicted porin